MKLTANGIQIEVEDTGGEGRPVILLIMGLGMQLIAWPDAFVQALADAGFRVVRYDNRDIGLSQTFDEAGTGNLVWQSVRQRIGLAVRSAYTLQDMANDGLGVLDALGIRRAHVVGASMGGMIAQRLAATAPQRMASLVSIMSSSGARNLPGPRPDVAAALLRRPASRTEAALVAHSLGFVRLIASPAYPQEERVVADRIARGPTGRRASCARCWPSARTAAAKPSWRALPLPPSSSTAMPTPWYPSPAARIRRAAFQARTSSPCPAWGMTCRRR